MRIAVIGHVDHGKSTLIGRLFHDLDKMPDGRMAQLKAVAARRGVAFEFANLTDGLQAERDQNITIDTTQVRLRHNGRELIFIDAPGHREFIRNMVTGASRADAALMVVDANDGVSEQTRRHALLLTLLGVTEVVVVINKFDACREAETRFAQVASELSVVLASIGIHPAAVLPAAAAPGWNVVQPAEQLAWFTGPTVIAALLDLTPRGSNVTDRVAFVVQDVYRRHAQRVLVGRLESGRIRNGDAVDVLPSGTRATVDIFGDDADGSIEAGDVAAITVREPLFVSRGDVLSSPAHPLAVVSILHARVFWLGRTPMRLNGRYDIRIGTQRTDAELTGILRVIDASALVERESRTEVPAHDVADVELKLTHPLVVDTTAEVLPLARFVVVDRAPSPDIVGGGVVLASTPAATRGPAPVRPTRVQAEERMQRAGHRGAVVWLTGLSGAGKSTLAESLERVLFDRGMQVVVLDGDHLRFGLNADLGFAPGDRRENIRRAAEVAKLFAATGAVVVTAFISPYRADRDRARAIVESRTGGASTSPPTPFIEVFVDAELATCEARDPKGLYRRARAGEIAEFTGVSAPYESPIHAELTIKTGECSVEAAVAVLLDTVLRAVKARESAH